MDPEEGEEFETEDFDELEDDGHPPEDQREDEDQPPEEEGLEDEPPARKPSRAQTRIEALDRTAREAIERAEAAERRVNEILNGNTRAEAERRERELIERMDPDERREHEARLRDQRTTHEIGSLRAQIADSTDRAKFGSACATNARRRKPRRTSIENAPGPREELQTHLGAGTKTRKPHEIRGWKTTPFSAAGI
jgi:hypothetical protein